MDYLKYGRSVRELTVGPSGTYDGSSTYPTIQNAIDSALPGDFITIYPGDYDEAVVIPDTKRDITLISSGRGRAAIAPLTAGSVALEVNGASGITLVGVDIASPSDGASSLYLHERVRAFRAFNCKIEGSNTVQLQIGHTAADLRAPADCYFEDCEIAWGSGSGMLFGTSSVEFPTEIYFRRLIMHDITGAQWVGLSAGGSFSGCAWFDCDFLLGEGAAPTAGFNSGVGVGSFTGGSIQLASNAAGLGTHTNVKLRGVKFTDSQTTV